MFPERDSKIVCVMKPSRWPGEERAIVFMNGKGRGVVFVNLSEKWKGRLGIMGKIVWRKEGVNSSLIYPIILFFVYPKQFTEEAEAEAAAERRSHRHRHSHGWTQASKARIPRHCLQGHHPKKLCLRLLYPRRRPRRRTGKRWDI